MVPFYFTLFLRCDTISHQIMKRLKCDTCIRKAAKLQFCTEQCKELWIKRTSKEETMSTVSLSDAVANAAVKVGICRTKDNLTDAVLVCLTNDLAETILEQRQEIYKLQQQLLNALVTSNGN